MGPTGEPQSLVRGARFTGSAVCLLLAVLTALWIVRDLRLVDDPARLWWAWAGSGPDRFLTATTLYDLVLLCVYVVVALGAFRSPVAASALVVTGLVTLAVRAPALWAEGIAEVYPHGLRMRAMLGTFVALGLAAALLIVVVAGRRPLRSYGRGITPTRPGRGAGVAAFLLLGFAGAGAAAWEVYWYVQNPGPPSLYADRFTGGGGALQLLGMPAGWASLVVVAVTLTGACGALARAVHSRPLGLVGAGLIGVSGAAGVSVAVRADLFAGLGELDLVEQLMVGWWVFGLVAGVLLVLVLGRRGVGAQGPPRLAPNVYDGYGGGPTGGYGAGYSSGYGDAPDGGAPGGTFGPPPPSSRPPGW
ncbi:hypothetical protein ACIQM4_06560 [Streptomyces sp. NPDC091272]|uniref:hypothetical protein n=1 Tax=Streptomyces sp. NPDC091272 TaxID=3365981 RepID=UPI0038153C6B